MGYNWKVPDLSRHSVPKVLYYNDPELSDAIKYIQQDRAVFESKVLGDDDGKFIVGTVRLTRDEVIEKYHQMVKLAA